MKTRSNGGSMAYGMALASGGENIGSERMACNHRKRGGSGWHRKCSRRKRRRNIICWAKGEIATKAKLVGSVALAALSKSWRKAA